MKPDVTAPGEDVLSSVPRREGLWASFSGTSMASPHVAGAAALLRQRHRGWTVEQIKSALVLTGKPVLGPAEARRTRPAREAGRSTSSARTGRSSSPRRRASRSASSRPAAPRSRQVALSDAGGGAGDWTVSTTLQQTAARCLGDRAAAWRPFPGPLVITATASPGAAEGDAHGIRRAPARRRPQADPVLVPRRRAQARPGADDPAHAHRHVPAATRGGTPRSSTRTATRRTRGCSASRARCSARSRCSASP